MKKCPHCHREVSDTALRCRYCRKSFTPAKKPFIKKTINFFRKFIPADKENSNIPWDILEIFLLWASVFLVITLIDYYQIARELTLFLRGRFFILVKEPLFQNYIYTFIATFLLKASAVGVIFLILKFYRQPFVRSLRLDAPIKREWLWIFPLFFMFALACRLINGLDPLSPNLHMYLFFDEARIAGNIISLFSILLVAPVSEEIFFRGFVYPGIDKRWGFYPAVLISAGLFTLVHVPQCWGHWLSISIILLGGIVLSLVRAYTHSTLFAVILHFIYNFTVVATGYITYLILKY